MKIKVVSWSISKLYALRDKIQDQPEYQRGDVWSQAKKKLLIDSILRGIDIPKIYLRRPRTSAYTYEVADGQQRIKAIFKFKDNSLSLDKKRDNGVDLASIDGHKIGDQKFSELPTSLKRKFDQYLITIAIVEGATNHQIRTLFGRLQLGIPLNPAEKRNAIISASGDQIDNFALNHKFFSNCRIPKKRYKHQDYLAHVFALIEYENKKDLKADLLEELYLDQSITYSHRKLSDIDRVLDAMYEINRECNKSITNKFAFIDIFWLLYSKQDKWKHFDYAGFAEEFTKFERTRLKNKGNPKALLKKQRVSSYDRLMYDYIMAFNYEGSSKNNIATRHRVFTKIFQKYIPN